MTKVYAVTVTGKFQSPIEKFAKMELVHETKITDSNNFGIDAVKQCAFDLIMNKFVGNTYKDPNNWKFEAIVREILKWKRNIWLNGVRLLTIIRVS